MSAGIIKAGNDREHSLAIFAIVENGNTVSVLRQIGKLVAAHLKPAISNESRSDSLGRIPARVAVSGSLDSSELGLVGGVVRVDVEGELDCTISRLPRSEHTRLLTFEEFVLFPPIAIHQVRNHQRQMPTYTIASNLIRLLASPLKDAASQRDAAFRHRNLPGIASREIFYQPLPDPYRTTQQLTSTSILL